MSKFDRGVFIFIGLGIWVLAMSQIFAPKIAGKPYPQGPNNPGAKYFLPFSKVGYAFPIAQLFPMSLEMITSSGIPA